MRILPRRLLVGMAILALMMLDGCTMPGKSFSGPLPPATPEQTTLADQLRRDVTHLATTIGHRDTRHPAGLNQAADYIEKELAATGLKVTRHPYRIDAQTVFELDANRNPRRIDAQTVFNLDAEVKGESAEIVLFGAHYDSVRGTVGANDNGTGVAAVLALARRMAKDHPKRTLRFAAFVNEEPPYFQTEKMGSLVYARAAKARGEKIVAMISVETIGCYSDQPGSQHYPKPLDMFYPSQGNFIAFVGNVESGDLIRRIVGKFRNDVRFPSEGASLLGSIEGVGWSDHWSFWQCGYPALMVTDTAPFRYKWYHTAEDTPEKIDYERTARVVEGLEIVVRDLLNQP